MSSSSQFRSVLDSGVRDRSPKVAVDRITRRRSPSRHREDDDVEVVVPRVSQPYRTSLSAVAAPLRVKKSARSRSVSPGGSLISGRSRSKSPGNRRSSPKHVTYDERVTVRHSDTEDSLVADLSGKESSLESSPCDVTDNQSPREVSSGHGSSPEAVVPVLSEQERHAAELRQTCHEITDWYSRTPSQSGSSPASTMDRLQVEPPLYISHSPDQSSADFFTSSPGRGDSGVYTDGEVSAKRGKVNIEKDYNHDRTISYRLAIKAHYSDEVKRLAAANIEEICPQRSAVDGKIMPSPVSPSSEVCPRTERSNTLPSKTVTGSDRDLHGSKKSVSASIGNFFRKISPRMSRREKHGRSSSSGSAQSLDTSTGGSHESNQSLDRSRGSRARRSFLRMIGRSRSRSQSKSSDPEDEKRLSVPHKNTEIQGHSELDGVNQALPDSTHRILKSIEQNKVSDKSVYQRFKEKQAHAKATDKTLQPKSQAMKASPDTSPGSTDTGRSTSQPNKENEVTLTQRSPVAVHQGTAKASPPQTLNVRSSQKPLMKNASVASGDESIGDCSLDVNLEGSEPTLLNTSQPSVSASRQVILSQDNVLCPSVTSPSVCCPLDPGNTDMQLSQPPPVVMLENGGLSKQTSVASTMPRLSNSCDISPRDTSKVPSYLKLSCAVSGYGRYSSYSSRKDINLSSPGTSASSLRSDGSSSNSLPGRSQPVNRTASLPLNFTKNHLSEVKSIGHVNGQIGDITCISNGHSAGIYPTGDAVKDGQYYLDLCQTEEERLLVLCGRAKGDMGETTLPEEANGRIRAAIGKTNLLITKKFKQFRGLCHKHMKPEGADRPTKWEDLQGFWDMVKIQIDDLDELFAEIAFMRQNEWKDVPRKLQSARSSANSSPKSPSLSLSSTPSQTPGHTPGHTPASRRKPVNLKDTPDSSPEKSVKSKQTAKAREDARKRMLAEKRAAMKLQKLKAQEQNNSQEVEIYLPDLVKK